MNDIITKDTLNQSIELISELNLNEDDYENIFEKFNLMMENPDIKEILEKISGFHDIEKENDLKAIMKKIIDIMKLSDLNQLLGNIIKNEDFIDFIQDLFLEKLI
ncbi:MAG: hypothetical protein ACFFAH_13760 [Promethearchaeota archaeon]